MNGNRSCLRRENYFVASIYQIRAELHRYTLSVSIAHKYDLFRTWDCMRSNMFPIYIVHVVVAA